MEPRQRTADQNAGAPRALDHHPKAESLPPLVTPTHQKHTSAQGQVSVPMTHRMYRADYAILRPGAQRGARRARSNTETDVTDRGLRLARRLPTNFQDTRQAAWQELSPHAFLTGPTYHLMLGDALTTLSKLPANSIDTCLTSPPYWQARDYGHPDQLGQEVDVNAYVQRIVAIFRQVRRTLADWGSVWLNIGDSYVNETTTVDGKPPTLGWRRNKQLALVPFRLALALEDDGWWVRNTLIWHKPNAMPSSVKDRLTNTWEPVFLLTKSDNYYFNLNALRLPHKTDDVVERVRAERGGTNGKASGKHELRKWLNSPRHRVNIDGLKEVRRRPNAPEPTALASYLRQALSRKGITIPWVAAQLGLPFERTRHYFRLDSTGARRPPEQVWQRLKELLDLGDEFDEQMLVEVGDNVIRNHPMGRNPGDVASISLARRPGDHFATMPLALAEWTLKATLPAGGVCLDPFMGTGTTGVAADSLGGRFVGIDIREEFLKQFTLETGVLQAETAIPVHSGTTESAPDVVKRLSLFNDMS